jgi:hypothetical protein
LFSRQTPSAKQKSLFFFVNDGSHDRRGVGLRAVHVPEHPRMRPVRHVRVGRRNDAHRGRQAQDAHDRAARAAIHRCRCRDASLSTSWCGFSSSRCNAKHPRVATLPGRCRPGQRPRLRPGSLPHGPGGKHRDAGQVHLQRCVASLPLSHARKNKKRGVTRTFYTLFLAFLFFYA